MQKTVIALTLLIVFTISCNKDELISSSTTPPSNKIQYQVSKESIINPTGIDNPTKDFHQNILETQVALLKIMVMVMRESMAQPVLYGLSDNHVETRACPNTSFIDQSFTGNDFKYLYNFEFQDPTMTANPCLIGGIEYSGNLTMTFEAPLGEVDPNSALNEITLSSTNGFTVNGYIFDLGNEEITLNQINPFEYSFKITNKHSNDPTSSVSFTLGDIKTTLPKCASGTFSIQDQGEDPDDFSLWIDNPFTLSLDDALVLCQNLITGDQAEFCVGTATGESIEFAPYECSCPSGGVLQIKDNMGDCGTAIDNTNSSSYDFGSTSCIGDNPYQVQELLKVVQLLSYEGDITNIVDGPAIGFMTTSIGVDENESPFGYSLQLTGTGSEYSEFTWNTPAVNTSGSINIGQSFSVSSTSSLPWINEFHYDNIGSDTGEFIEIAGPAGLDLSDYQIVLYNGRKDLGAGTLVYNIFNLSGIIDDEQNGFGAVSIPVPIVNPSDPNGGLENGSTDGIALIKKTTNYSLGFCQ